MARRFGRNQKRRMRAEIAAADSRTAEREREVEQLRVALEMDRGLLRRQTEKLMEADYYACEVAHIVGHCSILADEPKYRFLNEDARTLQVVIQSGGGSEFIRQLTLNLLDYDVVLDRLKGMAHVHVELAGGRVRYAISYEALRNAPRDWLVKRLSRELAEGLVNELRGHGR